MSVSKRGAAFMEVALRITHWSFALLALAGSLVVSFFGWMTLGFWGGRSFGPSALAVALIPLAAFPLFVLYVWKPRTGFYAILACIAARWLIFAILDWPHLAFYPLSSGIDEVMFALALCASASYWAYVRIVRTSAGAVDRF